MKIIVNTHNIELEKEEIINAGEYNVQECTFEFSEEYKNLVKAAIFSSQINSYKVNINDTNKCIIPYEVLENENIITIGVYGYEINGEELIKRYSPSPKHFKVEDGSYKLGEEVDPPSPSIIEQLQQKVEELSNTVSTFEEEQETQNTNISNLQEFKVDKVMGKELSTNDYTNEEKQKLSNLENYDDTQVKRNIQTNASNISDLQTNKADKSEIPDVSNFITNSVDNLLNYYKKSETFTKQEVNDLISAITTMDLQVVQTLPTEDISTTTIYLVPKNPAETNNAYDEYIYVSNAWELIGSTEVDLTNYVQFNNYASDSKGGVIKTGVFGTFIGYNNALGVQALTYQLYQTQGNNYAISKGTLENVITGKDLTTKSYVDGLVGDIATALDEINGEVVN